MLQESSNYSKAISFYVKTYYIKQDYELKHNSQHTVYGHLVSLLNAVTSRHLGLKNTQ